MTNKEKKDWLAAKFPLTVIRDRYDGTYSGAMWLAFPLDYDKIPSDVDASDPECAQFWKDYKEPVGRGAYASDAVADLIQQMRVSEPEESADERIRKELIALVRYYVLPEDTGLVRGGSITRKQAEAWLEKQKEPKPAEWGEEDIEECFKYHFCVTGLHGHTISEVFREGMNAVLGDIQTGRKPICSHWKPSEEQMSMLLAVIRDPNNAGSESCFLALQSLYEDLRNYKP